MKSKNLSAFNILLLVIGIILISYTDASAWRRRWFYFDNQADAYTAYQNGLSTFINIRFHGGPSCNYTRCKYDIYHEPNPAIYEAYNEFVIKNGSKDTLFYEYAIGDVICEFQLLMKNLSSSRFQ